MKDEKYFVVVSIIAFLSLSYVAFGNFAYLNGLNDRYATVMTPVTATTSVQTSASTSKYSLPPEAPINYTDNKNGTITDNYTGLIWKKCPQGLSGNDCKSGSITYREWSKANAECNSLNFAGKSGWRIPTQKELQSIVDTGVFEPSINEKFFVGSNDPYWTVTSPAEYPGSKFTVIFSDGSTYYQGAGSSAATRCVYGGSVK